MKNISLRIAAFFIMFQGALQAGQTCPSPVPKEYQKIQPGNLVVGFFAGSDRYHRKYNVKELEKVAPQLTHIIYAFARPDVASATAQLQDPYGDVGADNERHTNLRGNFADLLQLKKKFPHLKILLSVGGGKYNNRFLQIADAGKIKEFAHSCVKLLESYTYHYKNPENGKTGSIVFTYKGLFDGLDIDWEFGCDKNAKKYAHAYHEFIKEVKKTLRKKSKKLLLTVDIEVNPKVYNHLPLAQIKKEVDWFNVMAYDFYSPRNDSVGLNAPICGPWSVFSIDGALNRLMEKGISPDKMVLGLPLYGHVYNNSNGFYTKYQRDKSAKAVLYYHIEKKFLNDPLFEKRWHPAGKSPSLYNKKDKIFISYDDHESLSQKVDLAKMKRMKGVALWRLSGDDDNHSLVKSILASWV